jgi:PCFT/HCP family folate transporter-like MFS transporter 1/3
MCKLWKILMYPRVYMTVEPILLVFMFSQFLSYPVYQNLIRSIVCDRTPNCTLNSPSSSNETSLSGAFAHVENETSCTMPSDVEKQVQAETSHWILYTNLALGLPSICFSIFYGSVSDRLGRKLFIILPALGAAMNTGVILEIAYLRDSLPLYMCLIGAFTSGLYGGYSVLNFAAYAYTADVTANSGRTRQIGLLESMTYLGATLSLLVGGVWMSRDNSYTSIFWCVFACQVAVIAYTIVALPESMYFSGQRSENRVLLSTYNRQFSQAHKFRKACVRFFSDIKYNICEFFKLLFTNWRLCLLLVVFFAVEINFCGITDVVFLYALGEPLCWSTKLIGYFLALKVFCNGVASLFILPVMIALHFSDTIIVLIGLVSGCVGLIMMGGATRTWIMFVGELQ